MAEQEIQTKQEVQTKQEPQVKQEVQAEQSRDIVVDATDHIAGRLASNVAKLLLQGKRVSLLNCEKIMMSGTRANVVGEYKKFLEIASILHPKHGPFHPRRPDTIISRMVRGMLPRKKTSGVEAHKRLRAYIGSPTQFKSQKKIQFEGAKIKSAHARYISMGELGRKIGWTE